MNQNKLFFSYPDPDYHVVKNRCSLGAPEDIFRFFLIPVKEHTVSNSADILVQVLTGSRERVAYLERPGSAIRSQMFHSESET